MRVEQLNLSAFGPFTDRVLSFEDKGLHVVYGPNEAGKSSALRALTDLLYGIESSSRDCFVHARKDLRVGGLLTDRQGNTLSVVRKTGRVRTLLMPDGTVLDDQALTPFLQGVSRELFKTLFGIDHPALRKGGKEILEQKGHVGQALFSAALGSHTLHDVLAGLDQEAADLFKPTGTKPKINASIRSYKELIRDSGQRALSSTRWDKHRRALDSAISELEAVDKQITALRSEVVRLERIQRVLPKLAKRHQLQTDIHQMGSVLELKEDFSARRQEALREVEKARTVVDKLTPSLEQQQSDLTQLTVNKALLSQAEKIEDLHASLGNYRGALRERPDLEAETQQLLNDARLILKKIRPELELESTDVLRPILAKKRVIADLAAKSPIFIAAVDNAQSALKDKRQRLLEVRKELENTPSSDSSDSLRREITAARVHGELDKSIERERSELSKLQSQCSDELSRLNFWSGDLHQISGLRLPAPEAIHPFDDEYNRLSTQQLKLEESREKTNEELRVVSRELAEIELVGQVMTETMLLNERRKRDTLWQLLRRQWVDGEKVDVDTGHYHSDETTLHDAFEGRLAAADEASDRLRRETDRVLKLANLQSRQESGLLQVQDTERQLQESAASRSTLDKQWNQLWALCQIKPGTPKEMLAWLGRFDSLRERVARLKLQQASLADLERTRSSHMNLLAEQMNVLGRVVPATDVINTVLLAADSLVDELELQRRIRDDLIRELKQLENATKAQDDDVLQATERLEGWRRDWTALLNSLALPSGTLPLEMDDLMENIRELLDKQEEAGKRQITMARTAQSAVDFETQVVQMVESLVPELTGTPADEAVARLHALVSDNKSTQIRQQQLQNQIEHGREEIRESSGVMESMNNRLNALCVEAGCDEHQQLEELEKRSVQYQQLKADLVGIETDIIDTSDGNSIEELQRRADAIELDSLPSRIISLKSEIDDELEPQRSALAQTKGGEENELKQMDGGGSAAELAEEASGVLAGIRVDAEHFVRVKLAARFLRSQIESYRQENQEPLVQRASEHFAALTLHAFDGLSTDFNEKDEPVLAGIRAQGSTRVHVEGMSSGTLDQLYLALRLASLEKYLANAEPMPFIVDDVLIEFDDERSQAALQAMAELAESTQVILFTHHSHVLEQSRRVTGNVQTHRL